MWKQYLSLLAKIKRSFIEFINGTAGELYCSEFCEVCLRVPAIYSKYEFKRFYTKSSKLAFAAVLVNCRGGRVANFQEYTQSISYRTTSRTHKYITINYILGKEE